ncbi:MAG: FkbM family methyltransferase [Phycisphaerales bacterium]
MHAKVRLLLERIARGRVFRKRLPASFGGRPIYVSPDSALSYLKASWSASEDLFSAATRYVRPGACVWDIGGNVGVFALAAAHRAGSSGRVISVEADPFLASLLQRTVLHARNQDLSISVLCAAASSASGLARFNVAARGRSSNALEQAGARVTAGGVRYVQVVPAITLDQLLAEFARPDLGKIDVEGAEAMVLEGAGRLLSEHRPALYVEVGEEQRAQVGEILKRHRYKLFDGDVADARELDACAWNTLAVPQESSMTNAGFGGTTA